MRICHVNYYAAKVGGGIAGLRLHRALNRCTDAESLLAVIDDCGEDAITLCGPAKRRFLELEQTLLRRVYHYQRSENFTAHTFNLIPGGLCGAIARLSPDVVHLHSIVGEMLSIGEIAFLARNFKVVWTLHDSWPFTGSEQHPRRDSRRFVEGYLKNNREDPGADFDRLLWERKRKLWAGLDITFISPSNWIDSMLQASLLWKGCRSRVIGNCIDTDQFKPADKAEARLRLNLPQNVFLLGFGAGNIADVNKGGNELRTLLDRLAGTGIELATLGPGALNVPLGHHPLGVVKSPEKMVDFYNSCDLFLSTSKYDNLPNMIMESMACGTPAAAFANGGIPDLAGNGNGILTEGNEPVPLAERILQFRDTDRGELGTRAREHILANYNMESIARRHLELYREL